jgi:molybdopterin-binding protein
MSVSNRPGRGGLPTGSDVTAVVKVSDVMLAPNS